MMSAAALVLTLATANAPWPEPAPANERAAAQRFQFDFDFDFNDVDVDVDVDVQKMDGLKKLALLNRPQDDDDEDDRETRREEEREQQREQQREQREQMRRQRDEQREQRQQQRQQRTRRRHSDDEGEPTAEARGASAASLAVNGPITFQVRTNAGDVIVVPGRRGAVSVSLSDAPRSEIALFAYGDRIEPEFGARGNTLRSGKLKVELPPGSAVDLQSVSGDVEVRGTGGDVRVRTMSGDVKIKGAGAADVQAISGDVSVEDATGAVRLQTVSGNASVSSASAQPQLQFSSTSGNLSWAGLCGRGCRLTTETVSGDVKLALAPQSSFGLSYVSQSGTVDPGGFDLSVKRRPKKKLAGTGGLFEATFGSGEGVIESDAFSGDLHLQRR